MCNSLVNEHSHSQRSSLTSRLCSGHRGQMALPPLKTNDTSVAKASSADSGRHLLFVLEHSLQL